MLTPLTSLLRSSHPEPVVAVSLVGGLLSLAVGRGWASLWMVAAIFCGQLSIGWTNDYLDRDLDRRQHRTDKPLAANQLPPPLVAGAALAALAACVPLSLISGLPSALTHLAAIALAMLYNAGLKLTLASVLPYAAAFGLLPSVITLAPPLHHVAPWWATAAAALLGSGGHFAQVLPDIPADRAQGIRGLPQQVGERGSALAAATLLAGAQALIALGPGKPAPLTLAIFLLSLLLTAGVAITALRNRPLLAFRLTLAAAGLAGAGFLLSGRSL